jgi:hypothetical protein
MRRTLIALFCLGLVGCAQLPPSPADIQAKRFEPVADKAVIYVVRQPMDSHESGWLLLDNYEQITTLPGTYYRWEVEPGVRRIMGVTPGGADAVLNVKPGQIYFLRHTVFGTPRTGPTITALSPVDPQLGRSLVAHSELLR